VYDPAVSAASIDTRQGSPASTIVGVALSLVSASLLGWASLLFAFYGYCEDACDKPPRAFWPAVGAGLPYALLALGVMAVACWLFQRGRGAPRPSKAAAALLAIVACASLIAGLYLIVVVVSAFGSDGDALLARDHPSMPAEIATILRDEAGI
jgi:hypothetical protein